MKRAHHEFITELALQLQAIHQPHQECPSHELAFDEGEFQRVFGAGDERQQKPVSVNQALYDAGHKAGDFA